MTKPEAVETHKPQTESFVVLGVMLPLPADIFIILTTVMYRYTHEYIGPYRPRPPPLPAPVNGNV